MNDNVKNFLEEVAKDPALAEKIAGAETAEELLALAAEKGFALTAEDLASALAQKNGELDDDDLDEVTGGVGMGNLTIGNIGKAVLGTWKVLPQGSGSTATTTPYTGNKPGAAQTTEYRGGGTIIATTMEQRSGSSSGSKGSSGMVSL